VLVPAGLKVELSSDCEFSQPPSVDTSLQGNPFARNTMDGALPGCDNTHQNASMCCRVATPMAVEMARTLRCLPKIDQSIGTQSSVAKSVEIQHHLLPDGRLQIRLFPEVLPVGNYPVQLKISSGTSCYSTVEFILHIMKDTQVEAFMAPYDEDVYAQKTASAGFPMNLTWRADLEKSKKSYSLFDNLHEHTFGSVLPVAAIKGQEIASLSWLVEWTSSPCVSNVGTYVYCFHGVLASSPYDWQSLQCKVIRIVEDLPPVLSFYNRPDALLPKYREMQTSQYSVYMGQHLEIIVEARDNPSDTIDFLGISKVDINTGDRLRASIHMVSTQVGELGGRQSLWYAPQEVVSIPELEEITPPPFVSLTVGGPLHKPAAAVEIVSGQTWVKTGTGSEKPSKGTELVHAQLASSLQIITSFSEAEWEAFGIVEVHSETFIRSGSVYFTPAAVAKEVSRNRVISFVPTRMHSGLEMSVCMMAGDSRGLCRPLGDAIERCIQIKVQRCKYAVKKGEDLVFISGLFEVNWIQMWALNPTYLKPEVGAADANSTINLGQLYKVKQGEHVFDIARRFGMTMEQVMFFNADLSAQKKPSWTGHLSVESDLCIVPNSCFTHV